MLSSTAARSNHAPESPLEISTPTPAAKNFVLRPLRGGKNGLRTLVAALLIICLALSVLLGLALGLAGTPPWQIAASSRPVNIIFMVADGGGPAHLSLIHAYHHAHENGAHADHHDDHGDDAHDHHEDVNLEPLLSGHARTASADSDITDSAAGATAWACARKTNNRMVSFTPDGQPCATLMEAAKAAGMATGVAVTSSVTDATPAAFAAHVIHRSQERSVALQLAANPMADVVLGGGKTFFEAQNLPARMASGEWGARWQYVTDAAALRAASSVPLLGLFGLDNARPAHPNPRQERGLRAVSRDAMRAPRVGRCPTSWTATRR